MRGNKHKILLLQADTTQSLPIAKSLAKKGYEVHAIVSSKWCYGYGSRYIKKKFIFRDYEDIEKHYQFVLSVLKSHAYDTTIPMADHGAIVLSKYKKSLLKFTHFVMPDFADFERGYDKHKLMEACQIGGYPHPRTVLVEAANVESTEAKELKYPILIKPNQSCGARGITFINSFEELIEKFPKVYSAYGACHIQEFIPAGGAQVEVQLYVDENGCLKQSSVIHKYRWYPNNGGSSCCNVSTQNEKIVNTLYNLLKSIGWVGFADFDTIEDPRTGDLLIMELNPRVPACVKSAFASGIDWADIISSEYLGKEYRHYIYNKTVYLRHLGFEILWFMKSKNKFSTKPSWFNFFGRNIYYQDMSNWSDPMPFIRGTLGNIAKQLSPSFRKAKSGMN